MNSSILVPVWVSLKTAAIATLISFCLGIFAAYWMSRYQGKAKGLLDGILTIPLVLPPTVTGFLLLLVLGKRGFLGGLLDLIGIQIVFTWYATVIAATVVAFPLMYKSALAAFQQENQDLIDCARTLGASESTIFWRIILPLAKPGLIAGTLLSFARALGEFGATLMLAGSIPGKTQTIAIAIFLAAESGAVNEALWLVTILLVISLSVAFAINCWDIHKSKPEKTLSSSGKCLPGYAQLDLTPFTQENLYLEVDIQKQLPDFLLDIVFKLNSQQNPLGILGNSGAGKTTLLRCIAGLEAPDRGRIILNNRILFDSAKEINLPPQERGIAFLFQDYALFPHLTVAENISFGMPIKQPTKLNQEQVKQQLKLVNLTHMGDRFPRELSGGEQQRVALARALASSPLVTLLDEPLSALDTNLKVNLLRSLQKRLASYSGFSLYITHNLTEAYQLCPQLLIIDRGKAIAFDTQHNTVNHPPNQKTAEIIGCRNISAAQVIAPQIIQAVDWQCSLRIEENIPKQLTSIGIQAHDLILTQAESGINIFPVWLTQHQELPNMVILYLRLHSIANNSDDYHLETEVSSNQWQQLQHLPMPWHVELSASKIIIF